MVDAIFLSSILSRPRKHLRSQVGHLNAYSALYSSMSAHPHRKVYRRDWGPNAARDEQMTGLLKNGIEFVKNFWLE